MKSNLKRIFCLLLALAMMFSVAACGKASSDGSTLDFDDEGWEIDAGTTNAGTTGGDKGNTSVVSTKDNVVKEPAVKNADDLSLAELTAQIPSNLRGSTVHVFSWNPVKDVTGAEKVVADFEKKTGIKVKWEQGSYDKYDETIVAKINSGSAPDIIRYNSPNPARMSLTQDIQSATGFDFAGAIWDTEVKEAFTIKNKIYGINMKNTFNKQPTVVMYLKSTIENNELEDPYTLWKQGKWNFDKFLEMCNEFKEKTNGKCGWMSSRLLDIMWFRGIEFIEFDGEKYVNKVTDINSINVVNDVNGWLKDDILSGGGSETDSFCAGNYLFYTDNILGARRNDSLHYVEQKKNNDLYCVPFPQESGKTFYQPYSESEAFGIPKGAKNPTAVYYFLRYYLDANNYDSKMFFSNNQILETYNWCIAQNKQHHTIDRYITQSYDERWCGLERMLREGKVQAGDAQKTLESLKPKFQLCVDKANDAIKKF